MAIATTTAILIGSGIMAGTEVVGGIITNKANKKAAETQAGAAEKALEEEKRQYDTTRTDLERTYQQQRTDEAPYLGLGAGAVGALQYGLGLTPPTAAAKPTLQLPGAPIPQTGAGTPITPRINQERGAAGGAGEGPRGPMRQLEGGGRAGAAGMPLAQGGGAIPMRAPNGQTKMVPPDQVAHYTQLGAQVV